MIFLLFLIFLTVVIILHYFKFRNGPFQYIKKYKLNHIDEIIQELQPGDVVIFCAQKIQKKTFMEMFLRPLTWGVFKTCFVHPVLIIDSSKLVHWAGVQYEAASGASCPKQNSRSSDVYIDSIKTLFANHARLHKPWVVYRIYRRQQPTVLNLSSVQEEAISFCDKAPGPFRKQLQCIYFMASLLQRLGIIDSSVDVYYESYPGAFEKLLLKNGYYHFNDRLVGGTKQCL